MTEYHIPELSGAEGEPMTQLRCFVSVNPDYCLWGANASGWGCAYAGPVSRNLISVGQA